MIIKGRVHKFGNDINTDDIIAAQFLVSSQAKELGSHCMYNIKPNFSKTVNKGDIIIAGKNFACGSSREHAPLAIQGCGIACVIAKSFSGIFFRNAINIGLPFLESDCIDKISQGDLLEVDLTKGTIKNLTKNKIYQTQAFPEFLREIIKAKGLIEWVKKGK
jgi:3-isopropylmalate/(R)-2-methylmalate dehydratase small subunit